MNGFPMAYHPGLFPPRVYPHGPHVLGYTFGDARADTIKAHFKRTAPLPPVPLVYAPADLKAAQNVNYTTPPTSILCPPSGAICPYASEAGDLRAATVTLMNKLQAGCPTISTPEVARFQAAWLAAGGLPADLGLQTTAPDGLYRAPTASALQMALNALLSSKSTYGNDPPGNTAPPPGCTAVSLTQNPAPSPATTGYGFGYGCGAGCDYGCDAVGYGFGASGDMARALAELQQKSLEQIQQETAFVWMNRALAARSLYESTGDVHWLLDAHEYAHEAMEHAALTSQASALVLALSQRMPWIHEASPAAGTTPFVGFGQIPATSPWSLVETRQHVMALQHQISGLQQQVAALWHAYSASQPVLTSQDPGY